MQRYTLNNYIDLNPVKMTSPTCEDLGIPTEAEDIAYSFCRRGLIRGSGLHIDGIRYESMKSNPFSPVCMIPVPTQFTLDSGLEPSFIRKRNERERERVRCVNDGYERLKEHLPLDNKERRISKVETLRAAIQYIKHLQTLLDDQGDTVTKRKATEPDDKPISKKRVKKERQN
ncbi:achaete-scute homolog 4-like [Haliotis rubra]|uniref:achaete-scute homolog 4-like n=1 Tax=Haliotis rubra TaxID=36100 RepID=UPI001EE618BD|nr:achaete-scute homolog 4-like [Haliotis rubra]